MSRRKYVVSLNGFSDIEFILVIDDSGSHGGSFQRVLPFTLCISHPNFYDPGVNLMLNVLSGRVDLGFHAELFPNLVHPGLSQVRLPSQFFMFFFFFCRKITDLT